MEIENQPLLSSSITMEEDFKLSSGLEHCNVRTKIICPPSFPNDLFVFITYTYTISPLTAKGANFKLEILKPFGLSPRSEVTAMDIYECVKRCKDHAQSIVNNLFIDAKNVPTVKVLDFEDLQDDINSRLASS